MGYWIAILLIIIIISGFFGYVGIDKALEHMAKVIFYIFLALLALAVLSSSWFKR